MITTRGDCRPLQHAPSGSNSLNASSSSPSHEWFIDSGASYHMEKYKAVFLALNNCNTKNIFVGDDISLSVVGSRIVHLNNG